MAMFEKRIEKFHLKMLNVGVVYDSSVARHWLLAHDARRMVNNEYIDVKPPKPDVMAIS